MRKCVWIFLLAVLIPSAVLGWLALRSAEEQKIILERRTAELYQRETESLAASARAVIDEQRREFTDAVYQILAKEKPAQAAQDFSTRIAEFWSRKVVGFTIGNDGRLLSPAPRAAANKPEWQRFIWDNGSFLGGNIAASVYTVPVDALTQPEQMRKNKVAVISDADQNSGKFQVSLKGASPTTPTPAEAQRDKEAYYAMRKGQSIRTPEGKDAKEVLQMQMRFGAQGGTPSPAPPADPSQQKEEEKVRVQTPAAASGVTQDAAPTPGTPAEHPQPQPQPQPTRETVPPAVQMPSAPVVTRGAPPPPSAPAERPQRSPEEASPTLSRGARSASRPDSGAQNSPQVPDSPVAALSSRALAPSTLAPAAGTPAVRGVVPQTAPSGVAGGSGGGFRGGDAATPAGPPAAPAPAPAPTDESEKQTDRSAYGNTDYSRKRADVTQSNFRQVQPQQTWDSVDRAVLSNIAPETASFQMLCAGASEGILTRFVQDKLTLVFWLRPPQAVDLVFGCVINAEELNDLWSRIMPVAANDGAKKAEYVLALLDDKARPVTTAPAGETRDWKRPFVASEIGEALPHWEAALYLMKPEQLQESAAGLRRTVTFLIVAMLGAIAFGGWLVVADARRQLALAQQKTDFVSNVSHELKTPLTSIRMFAELMHGGKPETQAKAPQYLRIIMVEAERLTRLINNVLDFAKLERRQKRFDKKPIDLHCVIERTWESHELHLQESGFKTHWESAAAPYPVVGDEDALAQILVNLLSNAEKYSGERKEIDLHTYLDDHHVCVSVLDRGIGVPTGEERKIFEAFYRAHDSLSSGIQGSGLGLTLAQRLAREHDGEITYRSREGGGSAFTLRLPLARKPAAAIS